MTRAQEVADLEQRRNRRSEGSRVLWTPPGRKDSTTKPAAMAGMVARTRMQMPSTQLKDR